jgi:hypothetical protein
MHGLLMAEKRAETGYLQVMCYILTAVLYIYNI